MTAPSRVSGSGVCMSKPVDRGVMRPRLRALEKKSQTRPMSAGTTWLLVRTCVRMVLPSGVYNVCIRIA